MAVPHQKPVVVVVWLLAIADAVRQGIQLPKSDIVTLAGETGLLPNYTIVLGLVGPTLLVAVNMALSHAFPMLSPLSSGKAFSRWIDTRWGEGSLAAFVRALHPMLLVAVALCIMGAVGLLSAKAAAGGPFASQLASFALAAGVGFGIARAIAKRWAANAPWV